MAQIRTIDNQRHGVKESKQEIDQIMTDDETVRTGIVHLNLKVSLSSYKNGIEQIEHIYEPVSFIRQNIMMYY